MCTDVYRRGLTLSILSDVLGASASKKSCATHFLFIETFANITALF